VVDYSNFVMLKHLHSMKNLFLSVVTTTFVIFSYSQPFNWAVQGGQNPNIHYDSGEDIVCDAVTGDSYVTGTFAGTATFTSIAIGNTIIGSTASSNDVFVAKYDVSGNVLWIVRAGGTLYDVGYGITLSSGRLFITGSFEGTATLELCRQ